MRQGDVERHCWEVWSLKRERGGGVSLNEGGIWRLRASASRVAREKRRTEQQRQTMERKISPVRSSTMQKERIFGRRIGGRQGGGAAAARLTFSWSRFAGMEMNDRGGDGWRRGGICN